MSAGASRGSRPRPSQGGVDGRGAGSSSSVAAASWEAGSPRSSRRPASRSRSSRSTRRRSSAASSASSAASRRRGDDGSTRARISGSTDLEAAGAEADHVIETVIEVLDAKVDVLQRLDAVCRDDVIFASNTSQFPISKLAAADDARRPGRRQPLVQPAAADEADRADPRRSRPPTRRSPRRSTSRTGTARRRSSARRTRRGSSPPG